MNVSIDIYLPYNESRVFSLLRQIYWNYWDARGPQNCKMHEYDDNKATSNYKVNYHDHRT